MELIRDLISPKGCQLSQSTMSTVMNIRHVLKENLAQADSAWENIFGKEEECDDSVVESGSESEGIANEVEDAEENLDMLDATSTQFHFTQCPVNLLGTQASDSKQKGNVAQCIYEALEYSGNKSIASFLEPFSEDEVVEILEELEKKLTIKGIDNLCRTLNDFNLEEKTRFIPALFNCVLLPKIANHTQPSRILSSAIISCAQLFPNETNEFLLVPLLGMDLQDITSLSEIIMALEPSRKTLLLKEFSLAVEELQSWHLPLLQNLLPFKADSTVNTKLIKLFLDKALDFSRDKTFGKLLLLFVKSNSEFTEEQKKLLREITNTHETLFKKPLENLLKIA